MYLLIIFLPLLGSIIAGLFVNYLSKKGILILNLFCITVTSFLAFFMFYDVVLCHSICSIKLFPWIESNIFIVYWGFLFDNLTATMLIVVTFVSCLVHYYSVSYMGEDPHLPRFMSYLSLFTFFMAISRGVQIIGLYNLLTSRGVTRFQKAFFLFIPIYIITL